MGKIRIIGGQWRARTLHLPDFSASSIPPSFRPSTDRVRTTLFNWLNHFGAINATTQALDVYCGSGILGLESLSRGGRSCHFVDQSPLLIRLLQSTLAQWNNETFRAQATFSCQSAESFFQTNTQPYDLIFCDPPYHETDYSALFLLLQNALSEGGWCYLESGMALQPLIASTFFHIHREQKIAGSWCYLLNKLK